MTAFYIATATLKNTEKFQEYAQKSAQTFEPFGGEVVIRGKFDGAILGNAEHQVTAIVKFPDQKKLADWYESDAYQALVPLRTEAADAVITKYVVPES